MLFADFLSTALNWPLRVATLVSVQFLVEPGNWKQLCLKELFPMFFHSIWTKVLFVESANTPCTWSSNVW